MNSYWFLDTLVRVHVRGEDTDGRYSVVECLAPAGHQPPPHVHHDDDEGFYVIEGEITVYAGDDETVLGPGDFLNAPRGVPHTFRVTSAERARVLVTSAPARFDAFVRALGEPATRDELPVLDGSPDVERLVATAARYGVEILGPPGMLPKDLAASASAA
jgi:mannose-6-phosphate isomerase-like protein (cupin superfamily)